MNTKHELVADIPLIIGFCKQINLLSTIDKLFPTHGNQKGLSNGQLVLGWIAHMLTKNNHCKAPVEEWSKKHKITLQALLGSKITETDFEDCRLGRLVEKFAEDTLWHNLEEAFYKDSFSALELDMSPPEEFKENSSIEDGISKTIKLDSTTAYGHHKIIEDGVMQKGWSKDHRPDLPQLKIMVAVEGKTGLQITSDVVPGNENDDPLYLPVIERTRTIVDTTNCLMCGDCKMSALYIRASIAKNKEFYLAPMQMSNEKTRLEFCDLVKQIVDGNQEAQLINETFVENNKTVNRIIGAGYEIEKNHSYVGDDGIVFEWRERLLIVRSFEHAKNEIKKFETKVTNLENDLIKLTSKLHSSKETAEKELLSKIEKKLNSEEVSDLFKIETKLIIEEKNQKRSEKRNGKVREGYYKIVKYRYAVSLVRIDLEKLTNIKYKLGWRLYVTNAEKKHLTFCNAYKYYRKTMYVIEIGFHVLKDYIKISPLFVRNQDQIIGMTRLLMLALKILTLMTAEIRSNMKKDNIILEGIYAGQPKRQHPFPTAQSILQYFSRQDIALIGVKMDGGWKWDITPLTCMCQIILKLLRISESYNNLVETVSKCGLIF